MTTSDYYKNSILYPSIAVLLLTIIFSVIENRNYNSEWFTSQSVYFLAIMTSLIYSFFISILCLPILLVRLYVIKRNKTVTLLCWFLLPSICIMTSVIHEIIFNLKYNEKFESSFIYVIILNMPFLVGLVWTYIKYRTLYQG